MTKEGKHKGEKGGVRSRKEKEKEDSREGKKERKPGGQMSLDKKRGSKGRHRLRKKERRRIKGCEPEKEDRK